MGKRLLVVLSMLLLTVPIFFPLVTSLGYDPIWFGIVVVVVTEISLITPPVVEKSKSHKVDFHAEIDAGVPLEDGLADRDIDGELRDGSPDLGADER